MPLPGGKGLSEYQPSTFRLARRSWIPCGNPNLVKHTQLKCANVSVAMKFLAYAISCMFSDIPHFTFDTERIGWMPQGRLPSVPLRTPASNESPSFTVTLIGIPNEMSSQGYKPCIIRGPFYSIDPKNHLPSC
jgi:hypothetical protein